MKWVPSAGYTVVCIGIALLISFLFVGLVSLIGHLLGYQLNETSGFVTYSIFSVLVFGFLICIPEDTEL